MHSGGVPVPASPLLLVHPTDHQMDIMAPADRGKEPIMCLYVKGNGYYVYEEDGKYYVQKGKKDDREKTVISKEIFDICRRTGWKESKRKSREKICRDGKGVRCKGDCSKCPWLETGKPLSLEQLEADGVEPAGFPSVEAHVVQRETCQELYTAIDTLAELDKSIIDLYYFGNLNERAVGQRLGIAQKTVNNHKRKILPMLEKVLEKNQ